MDDDLLTALYHAASSEEPDTMDGPSLCDYYQRTEEARQARRALVDTVGDEVDVDSYGAAMECQGFVNGFKLALGLCVEGDLMNKEERRQRAEKFRQEREREAQLAALRQIRDDHNAAPGERLEAVKLLMELEGG